MRDAPRRARQPHVRNTQLPAIERPRDFQLRPEDAQRLRPNRIRRLFGSFGTARDGFSRPLALGLTTLGLAGLMVGILPGTLSFGGASSRRWAGGRIGSAAGDPADIGRCCAIAPSPGRRRRSRRAAGLESSRQRAWASTTATARSLRLPDRRGSQRARRVRQWTRGDRRRTEASLALRGLDRRLAADRHLRDAAHRRARAVRPALDLAPLRRLTTGRSCRPGSCGERPRHSVQSCRHAAHSSLVRRVCHTTEEHDRGSSMLPSHGTAGRGPDAPTQPVPDGS